MKDPFQLIDLASERLGGRVLEVNDEFFAPKENLLKFEKPIYAEDKYTDRGKWMDGWETRRRRTPGYDWCLIRLGLPGVLRSVTVDTSFFKGNYPESFSLEACDLGGSPPIRNERNRLRSTSTRWIEIVPQATLKGDSQNIYPINHAGRFTHLRLKIYPDGGIARLRVHGEVVPGTQHTTRQEMDLAAVGNGGSVVASSDQFFGTPVSLLMPGRARNMGDGWETRRKRGPGHDWVILKLGIPGTIGRIEVDTLHFKGNFPESCSVEACALEGRGAEALVATSASDIWKEVLPRTTLKANHRHVFRSEIRSIGKATHARFNIFPDGGVGRLRLIGTPEDPANRAKGIERLNRLPKRAALKALLDSCGSRKWAERMIGLRPFVDAAHLLDSADRAWAQLSRTDWLEAFRHHPPIGGARAAAKQSEKARRLSAGEQAAARATLSDARAALVSANRAYHAKFGYVFLICATGKTSAEILKNLRQRLQNDSDTELKIAAEEQRAITRLRLEKLLAP